MKTSKKLLLISLGSIILFTAVFSTNYPAILPLRKRASVVNDWLKIRLNTILPEIMRREKLDMWIVICREYNEDPVFLTLVPAPSFAARRNTMLVFFDRGEKGIEKLAVSRYGIGKIYKGMWKPEKMNQWECLGKVVRERKPKKIGINVSDTFAFADGLTASLKVKLMKAIGPKYASRTTSAENLAIGWLETRIPEELEVYTQIVGIAHAIIAEAFSRRIITPGVTSITDVRWWIREKINSLGLKTWFHPSVSIQRFAKDQENTGGFNTIKRGDLLHCDIGITYLRLNTDTQEHAYVLRQGEGQAPEGLQKALKMGNRLQDFLTAEFKAGRTGNEILKQSLDKARAAGLKPSIYTHPLGYHGHAAGTTIGLWDQQGGVPGKGDYPLYYNTCHSIELNIKTNLKEWMGQEIRIALEQDAAFIRKGIYYIDGRQTTFHLIK